jgi:hypothetical protein
MRRVVRVLAYAVLLGGLAARAGQTQTPAAQAAPVTINATIEAIDKANRVVTLKGPKGNSIEVKAPEQMEGFNSLRVGDLVSATYFEAVAVQVRKPGDPAPSSDPETTVARKDRKPGSETRRQQTFRATVEAVDAAVPSVRVKGPQGRAVVLRLEDPKLLQNLKVGDSVDVTYFESLLVKVARPPQ